MSHDTYGKRTLKRGEVPDVLQDAENAADNICLERIQQPAKPQSEYYFNMPRRPWKPVEPGLDVAFYFNMLRHCELWKYEMIDIAA